MDSLLIIQTFILSVVIGLVISSILGIKSLLSKAVVIVIIYFPLSELLDRIDKKEKGLTASNNATNSCSEEGNKNMSNNDMNKIVNSPTKLPHTKEEQTGPLDSLEPEELKSRLNYLHYATAHPYKPMKYQEYKSENDIQIDTEKNTKKHLNDMSAPKSLKHLEYSKIHYPDLSENQINYNDCTSHGYGELSCNQPVDKSNLHYPFGEQTSILVNGISNDKELKQVIREDF